MAHALDIELPEPELVDAARQGARPAFDALVDRHAAHAWNLAWRIVRTGPDSEEILRETVLAAWRTLPAYSGEISFGMWLDRTAVSRALRLLERFGEPKPAPTAGRAAAELAELPQEQLLDRVASCRSRLPGSLRAVLVLLDGEGRSVPEAEILLSTPADAVRQRLWRARMALWRCLTGHPEPSREEAAAQHQLCAFLDDELGAAERAAFEKKLAHNPALGALARDLGTLRRVVHEDQAPPLPPGLLDRIKAQLPSGEPVNVRPRRPRPAERSSIPESLGHGPALRVVAVAALLAALAGGAWALVKTDVGMGLRARLFGTAADAVPAEAVPADAVPADAAPAGAVPANAAPPAADSPAVPATAPAQDAAAAAPGGPAAAAAPSAATSGEAAAPAAPSPAPLGAATAPSDTAAAEPVPEPVPAAADPVAAGAAPDGAPPAPLTDAAAGTCGRTYTVPGGALGWAGAPPENTPRVLGGLARDLGGRGILLDGDAPRVRITVPASNWDKLAAALRARGVTVDPIMLPPDVDCASVVVSAP